MKNDSTINNLPKYRFDAYTGTFQGAKHADIPLQFVDKSHDSAITPLVEYLLDEINIFNHYTVQTGKPVNGYTRAVQFIDPDTAEPQFKLLYGGRSQNSTICLAMMGKTTHNAYSAISRHFNMKTTRIDSAVNYVGNYHAMQKTLKRMTDKEPSHRGNNSGGHTYYFGNRTSTTFVRHYEWGKCHFPKQPEYHNEQRIEVEYKPKDLAHQFQAQDLSAEQVFLRSTLGRIIHERIFNRPCNPVHMVSIHQERNKELMEALSHVSITYMKTWKKLLAHNGGDLSAIGQEIFGIIEKHEKWMNQA